MPVNRAVLNAYIMTQLDPIVRRIVLELFTSLVKYTPVDTGRARAGWNVQKNKPSTASPPVGKKRYSRPRRTTLTSGLSDWYITNNVEYILVLDQGRNFRDGQKRGSLQAPKGMTTLAINDLTRALRRAGIRPRRVNP